jgi:hypothetical protein
MKGSSILCKDTISSQTEQYYSASQKKTGRWNFQPGSIVLEEAGLSRIV